MSAIQIDDLGGGRYEVTVQAGRTTRHTVTCTTDMIDTYAPGTAAEDLLEASFEFLLEREPNTAILSRFELPVIEQYFPSYRSEILEKLS